MRQQTLPSRFKTRRWSRGRSRDQPCKSIWYTCHQSFSVTFSPLWTVPVRHLLRDINLLARKIRQPDLPQLARRFLFATLNPDVLTPTALHDLPEITSKVYIYNSAHVVFYAPSDFSGLRGMHRKWIRSTASWYRGRPRRDCVFVGNSDSPDAPGFMSLLVARMHLFFSFKYNDVYYPCALVHWFSTVGDTPMMKRRCG